MIHPYFHVEHPAVEETQAARRPLRVTAIDQDGNAHEHVLFLAGDEVRSLPAGEYRGPAPTHRWRNGQAERA